jgi:5-methyltetrahydrofolate--homocysteine methyltransferase
MPSPLLDALNDRVVVVGGAMGTALREHDLSLDDFAGLEGCGEILNVTRPDVVRGVHRGSFEAGADAVETNTFGANLANLAEYGIPDRIRELSLAGARLARDVADEFSTSQHRRFVLGSVGPGTKLPTLGHAKFTDLRDAYAESVRGLLEGGIDAVVVESSQDLLQTKAAIIGARHAMHREGRAVPVIAQVTVETTGTMLLGSEIGAALSALEPLGLDLIGLNCATGPAEMSEHLRYLAEHSRVPLSAMPDAGLPDELAEALATFVTEFGARLVGGCCGTTSAHIRAVAEAVRDLKPRDRRPRPEPGVSSLYQAVPFRQDTSVLVIGERTNANGSKAFREAMLAGRFEDCVRIAREQTTDGAHLLDLCVDHAGRDGVADMTELAGRLATASTLPIMLDSSEADVLQAGLQRLGGRCAVNSVSLQDGSGPSSRYHRTMELVTEYGAAVVALCVDETGQARTAAHKVAVATRLIEDLTRRWGMRVSDIIVDTLTFTIATGRHESRRDAAETIDSIRQLKQRYPEVQTTLGLSNVSFGLNPAARQVLDSVFLHECVQAGLATVIADASKILPMARILDEQRTAALDLVHDRRAGDRDPLTRFMELFAPVGMARRQAVL